MNRLAGYALVPRRYPFALIIGLTMTFVDQSTVFAGTIEVPNDFGTIQAAINAAGDGDVVVVAPGNYNEAINFIGKAITVQSSQVRWSPHSPGRASIPAWSHL